MRRGAISVALAVALAQPAGAADPPVPPGEDPGGVAVGLFTTGIDYTRAEVAARLARDGEGEIIGWDAVDDDNRPYPSAAPEAERGSDLVRLFRSAGRVRVVPVRVDPANPASLARAVAFLARTPVRIAVVPMSGARREDWEPFREAAARLGGVLFVVATGTAGDVPAALALPNMISVAAGSSEAGADAIVAAASADAPPRTPAEAAVIAADAVVACAGEAISEGDGAGRKARMLALLETLASGEAAPGRAPCAP